MPRHPLPTVWQAVADPTRRRLIELLRGGPRTTGDLARSFAVTRFAVMKHLRVLEAAGLVRVRPRGRERWHELDPDRLAELASRWRTTAATGGAREVKSAPRDAGSGRREPEDGGRTADSGGPVERGEVSRLRVELEVYLDAAPPIVFDALTFGISAWWGHPYLRSSAATGLILEGHLGGRFSEEWGHRQGVIRGTVTAIRQDERLEITGALGPDALLPAVLAFTLAAREGGTLLHFEHRALVQPASAQPALTRAYSAAWRELLAVRLKAFVERGARAGLAQPPGANPHPLF